MKWLQVLLIAGLSGFAVYFNRSLAFELEQHEQFALVLTTLIFLLVSLILMLAQHLGKLPEKGKSAIVLGWLITAFLAIETFNAISNHHLRVEIAEAMQNTKFATVTSRSKNAYVLNGLIGKETTTSLKKLLATSGKKTLLLNSGGGSLEAAMDIAALVRQHKLTVVVTTECSSACVLIAIASDNLMAFESSKFGFHRGSIFGSHRSEAAIFWEKIANDQLMAELRRGKIPESILAIAQKTPPHEMHYVSAQQLKAFRIVRTILE